MSKEQSPEVILVARDATVQKLLDAYASSQLTYSELEASFRERGWSTLSLYEVCRSLKPND